MTGKSYFVPAIAMGVITTAVTGVLLLIPGGLLLSHFLGLWFSKPLSLLSNWQGTLLVAILFITLFILSLFLAAFSGGWICAKRSGQDHEYSHALFLSILWAIATAILYSTMEAPSLKLSVAAIVPGPAGYFTAAKIQIRKKQKQRPLIN
ncbi:MAG: hypothetical protein DI535_13370 [Citrobacter freundii]|nr:MAG: hypothetical protein DI535_13370 [Citrobacter freundii]